MVMDQTVIIVVALILGRRGCRHAARFGEGNNGGVRVSHHIALARSKTAAHTVGREGGDGELMHGKSPVTLEFRYLPRPGVVRGRPWQDAGMSVKLFTTHREVQRKLAENNETSA